MKLYVLSFSTWFNVAIVKEKKLDFIKNINKISTYL